MENSRGQYKKFQQSAYQKAQHSKGFCPIIRHGERSDNVDYEALGIEIEQM